MAQYQQDEQNDDKQNGFWECQSCKTTFHGKPIHASDCPKNDEMFSYDGITYWYTKAEKEGWTQEFKLRGFYVLTLKIPAKLPETIDNTPRGLAEYLLKQAVSNQEFTRGKLIEITEDYINSIEIDPWIDPFRWTKIRQVLEEILD